MNGITVTASRNGASASRKRPLRRREIDSAGTLPSRPLNIIVCHNFYQQPGGEDQVFAEEADLLGAHGHNVIRFTLHNDAIEAPSGSASLHMLGLIGDTVWNRRVYHDLRQLVRRHRADVVHFHNTFPLMSPAAYHAARAGGAAVVQTLHNYRLLCPAGTFFRDGAPANCASGEGRHGRPSRMVLSRQPRRHQRGQCHVDHASARWAPTGPPSICISR